AGYTPTAMIAEYQHGLIRLDVTAVALLLIVAGLALASIWMRAGLAVRRRAIESAALAASIAAAIVVLATVNVSWDLSEGRRNSFSRADEHALEQVRGPLTIVAHLAPEDPRRADLEHRAFAKLRRTVPRVDVRYVSATSIGLFEQTAEHYGEVWYDL